MHQAASEYRSLLPATSIYIKPRSKTMINKLITQYKARRLRQRLINRQLDNLTDDTLLQRSEEAHHVKA